MDNEEKEAFYASLEKRMLKYSDYQNIPVRPSAEPLVEVNEMNERFVISVRADAVAATGLKIFVRQGVKERLEIAADILQAKLPGARLDIGYGYRSDAVQRQRFWAQYNQLPDMLSDEEKLKITHRKVAVPWLAGHPTGGAVDIAIAQNGVRRDFGTDMWNFSRESYSFAPLQDIGVDCYGNRALLRTVMKNAGFAPYDGEWWHFSYGDKEWAAYYNEPNALYEQIEFKAPDSGDV